MSKSRAVLNKSRVILLCILVFGTLVEIGAYYYVKSYVPNIFPSSELASPFQIGNLTINPYETSIGQSVDILVDVVNIGNIESTYSLSLKINGTLAETRGLVLGANETQQVEFNETENDVGTYNVTIGDQSGTFIVLAQPVPLPADLKFANLILSPVEAWPNQQVNVTVDVTNTGNETLSFALPFNIDGAPVSRIQVDDLAPHQTQTVITNLTEGNIGSYKVTAGGQGVTLRVVEEGKHTLHVLSSRTGFSFTLDGTPQTTPSQQLVDDGQHTVTFPAQEQIQIGGWGTVTFAFSNWNTGSTSGSQTFDVEQETYAITNYIRLGSCPSLFTWNGTGYNYAGEISDGSGWLGYLNYFNNDGSMVFSNNYPWDYIKLDSSQLQPKNGYYDMKIAEMSNEIFYLDQAKLVAVDHPINTDVFSTTGTFIYNLVGQGTMYTVSKTPAAPVSAVNGQGQNVLPLISKLDGNFTTSKIWTWNNITLNLGDLSGANEIKLVVGAKITWPTTAAGGSNFMTYANQPGVTPSPPPYMEVKATNGSWVRVPDDRQFPLPDVTDDVFVVNLTGLFSTNDYELRINTYQNIQFDYIGVDTTSQANITVQTIIPSSAVLEQGYTTNSNSSGAFTRYGDVLPLLQSADDKFVIGREGDVVSLQFPVDTTPVPAGMVRDYFVIASCWFKGTGLPYMPFTVAPMPFQAMTSFPYPANESYPYDATHNAYIKTYNTRLINNPTG
jgi:CARDB